MWAAYQGDALSVDILLKHGADVNAKDLAGLTPLHWAVVRGNKLCIRYLLERGADISAKDENGKSAKDMAQSIGMNGFRLRCRVEAVMLASALWCGLMGVDPSTVPARNLPTS